MYTVLLLHCTDDMVKITKDTTCKLGQDINLLPCQNIEDAHKFMEIYAIHCVIANLQNNDDESIEFLQYWQSSVDLCMGSVIIIASNNEILLKAIPKLSFCEIACPTNINISISLFLKKHYLLFQQLHYSEYKKSTLSIKTDIGYKNLSLNEIIYIEASKHKCTLHTNNNSFMFSAPLCQVKDYPLFESFKQSHRSYLINPMHIKQIDKSQPTWTVHFRNSNKEAYVSRTFKKTFEIFQTD